MAATIIAGVCEDHQDYELIRHDQTSQNWDKRETEQDCMSDETLHQALLHQYRG